MPDTMHSFQNADAASDVLALKSNAIAMHYACTRLSGDVHEGALFPALVERLLERSTDEGAFRKGDGGDQYALVRVASADGGFRAVARTAVADMPPLARGELVLWLALGQPVGTGTLAEGGGRNRIGLVCGVLAPEVMPHNGHLRLAIDYGVIR